MVCKRQINNLFLLLTLLVVSTLKVSSQVEFIKECEQKTFPQNIPKGNYSGITHIDENLYGVVSDKSSKDGFFIFEIDIDSITGEIIDARNHGFFGEKEGNSDEEAICYRKSTSSIFIARESDNTILEYDLFGKAIGGFLSLPSIYKFSRENYGLESLTYDKENHLFWTANESTLSLDGEVANSLNGVRNIIRIQSLSDDLLPQKAYAYLMDAPISNAQASNYAMGVSEITALDNGHLLILEREFYVPQEKLGAFVSCKLYEVDPKESKEINPNEKISKETIYMDKHLVYSFITRLGLLDFSIANYEGMCLGPTLEDGSRVLILISDSQDQYQGVLKDWFKTIVIRY